ncbi:transcription elongation factor GreB [Thiohalobacter sp.]|uniref:transcription elongation factor GreB n=1 Tax=Thiohalobacter sp. TaxID=2025948 RepID=UPI00262F7FCA|nr:transcription elongation factor GreB [Thiohalobacter sp.]
MSRYRPPRPAASPHITAEGERRLRAELDGLWRRRAEVTRALAAAAAEGDRSENAEYIYRKKELAGIDRRIRYLQKRIPALEVVSGPPADTGRVYFGAWVRLEDEDGTINELRIVGADEIDPALSWISIDAPLARALLGKGADDAFEVRTPGGLRRGWIVEVRYTEPTD